MKSNRIIATIAGVLLFLSIVLTSVWFYSTRSADEPAQIKLDQAVSKIEKREIKEVSFKRSQIELTDNNGKKFFASVGSDATRESLLGTIKEYNKINTSAPIKYNEEPVSSGWGWLVLINFLPAALFFTMWGLTLAVIVYAVRTLSRNKS
jgi:ATP-dependent Zn protease